MFEKTPDVCSVRVASSRLNRFADFFLSVPSPRPKLHEKRYSILDSAPFQVAMTATIYSLPTETKTRIAELCQLQDERFKEVFDALNTRRRAIRPSRVPARLQTTTSSPA
jgi:hypothetical protein